MQNSLLHASPFQQGEWSQTILVNSPVFALATCQFFVLASDVDFIWTSLNALCISVTYDKHKKKVMDNKQCFGKLNLNLYITKDPKSGHSIRDWKGIFIFSA